MGHAIPSDEQKRAPSGARFFAQPTAIQFGRRPPPNVIRDNMPASGLSGMFLNMRSTTEASFPWLSEHMAWKVSIPTDKHSALRVQKH